MTKRGLYRMGTVIGLMLLAITVFIVELPVTRVWTHWSLPLTGKTIAIDAGHGGADGGAVSKDGVIEKDLNLAIALYLRDYLQQSGAIVIMTREGDYDLASGDSRQYARRKSQDLKTRVQTINQTKVDLTISVHMNSVPSARWSGAQTFYSNVSPDNERLATVIQAELREMLGNTSRVAKRIDTLYLLKNLERPAALVEVGFLSHPDEASLLANQDYQRKVAAAVYRGILRYSSGETGKPVL
ncbi:MAG: N-acetylmuramoyl-L-alanine amidase CwlD [Candidatus Cohnella colombiensis]|uniref:N-acetylmuramoyl-L-alanine amidase CwlD n=1 Tax=Candidatus Cohnella colombiensis TaxID=3121368 RepID=A0AA95F0X5_9BACL|nr:MAG: N-acetylmuramoyl-L-alanine amidase CwlD [Cohnella sp.]